MSKLYYFLCFSFFFGIGLQSFGQKIFWAEESTGLIRVGDLGLTSVTNITTRISGLSSPRYIATDPNKLFLFYTVVGGQTLYRANYNGTSPIQLFDNGAMASYGDIDYSANANGVFSVNGAELNRGGSIDDDSGGGNTQLVMAPAGNDLFSSVSVDDGDEVVYFVDYDASVIYVTDFTGATLTPVVTTIAGIELAAFDQFSNRLYFTANNGGSNKIYYYDGSTVTPLVNLGAGSALSITGFQAYGKMGKIYYVLNEKINYYNIDGSGSGVLLDLTGKGLTDIGIEQDFTSPVFTALTPANNAVNVLQATTSLSLVFNENVKISTSSGSGNNINIRIFDVAAPATPVQTILRSASSNISISGSTVTLSGISGLQYGKQYYVLIGSQVFSDLSSNDFVGISTNTGWTFTMEGDPSKFFSRANGNWSTASTWSHVSHTGPAASTSPGTGADIVIGNGNTVTLTANTTYVPNTSAGFSILSGATLNAAGFTLGISGNFNIAGSFTNVGDIAMNFGSADIFNTSGSLLIANKIVLNDALSGVLTLHTDMVVMNGIVTTQGTLNLNGFNVCDATMAPPTPTTPAFTNLTSNSLTLSWTAGAGNAFVVARPTANAEVKPLLASAYTPASLTFGSGALIGTNNFLLYQGTGTSINVTGLSPSTSYTFDLYSYNTSVGGCYSLNNYQIAPITTCTALSVPASPVNNSYCSGDPTAVISVADPGSGKKINWYTAATAGSLATGSTGGTNGEQFTPATNGTYYAEMYEAAIPSCVSASRTAVTLTINPLPSVTNQTPSVCESVVTSGSANGVDLTTFEAAITGGATGVSVAWYTNAVLTASVGTPTSVTASNGAIFYAKVSNTTTFCFAVATVTFTVNPLPAITNQTPSLCETTLGSGNVTGIDLTTYESAITGGATGVSVAWYTNSALSAAVGTPTSVTALNGSIFYAKVSNTTTLCFSKATVTFTVNPLPAITNQTPSLCETVLGSGNTTGVNLTTYESAITGGATGVSVTWYSNSALTAAVGTPTSVTASNGAIFYAKVSNTTTLCFSKATVTFTINPLPSITNQTPILCESTAGSATATGINLTTFESAITGGATGVSVAWYTNSALSAAVGTPTSASASNGTIFYAKVSNTTTLCFSKATVTFTINPLPVTTITGNSVVCANATGIQYQASGSATTYTWSAPGATITSGQGTNTINVTFGTTAATIQVTPSNGGSCVGPAATPVGVTTKVVTVPASPTGASYCSGSPTVPISVADPGAGKKINWYTAATAGSLASGTTGGTNQEQFTATTNGTYYAEMYDVALPSCVSSTRTAVTLTVNPLPTVVNKTPALCESTAGSGIANNIDLTTYESSLTGGATGVSVIWYSNATLTAAVSTPTSASAINGKIYYAKVSNNTTLCSASATVTFTINPLPTTSITGNATVCANSIAISYQATGSASSYTWSFPTGTVITSGQNTNTAIVTFGASSGTVQVIPSNGVGCAGPAATLPVTCNVLSAPTNPTGASFCLGSPAATISVDDPGAGKKIDWYTGATGVVKALGTSGGTNGEKFTPTAGGTFFAEMSAVGVPGCVSSARTSVTLTANPVPVINSQLANLCESIAGSGSATGINLTSYASTMTSGAAGLSVSWFTNAGLTLPVGTPTSVSAVNGTIYYAKATNTTTQCSASNTATFNITLLPAVTITSGAATVCANATNIAYQASAGATSYLWTVPAGTSIVSGQNTNSIVVTFATSSGAIKVTPSKGSCAGTPATLNVTVNVPLNVYSVTGGGNFCANSQGVAVGLNNSDAGIKYELFRANVTTGMIVTSTGGAFNFSPVKQIGTYTVKASTLSPVNCQADMSGTASVAQLNPPAGAGVISGNKNACSGATETYTLSGVSSATDFQWTLPSGIEKVSQAGSGVLVKTNASGDISVVATNECGASTSFSYTINVLQSPTASLTLPSRAFTNDPVEFTMTTSSSSPTILWNFGDGNTSSDANPQNTYTSSGDFTVTLDVKDGNGCSVSDSKTLKVIEDPGLTDNCIKNVVTANGDTKNAFLYIDRIEKYPDNEVVLIDRWGVEVFRTNAYNNTWDLKKGNEYLPAGNYICIVKLNSSGKIIKRTVSVIK